MAAAAVGLTSFVVVRKHPPSRPVGTICPLKNRADTEKERASEDPDERSDRWGSKNNRWSVCTEKEYRVTIQVVSDLPLTSKQKFCFNKRSLF